MRISVKVKPRASREQVTQTSDAEFEVWVTEPPVRGKANRAVVRVLAEYFGVSQSAVSIVSGATSRNKIIVIE